MDIDNQKYSLKSREIIYLDAKDEIITVESGSIDIFTARFCDSLIDSKLYSIGRLEAGNQAFCFAQGISDVDKSGSIYRLFAIAGSKTKLNYSDYTDSFINKTELSKKNINTIIHWINLLINGIPAVQKTAVSVIQIYKNDEFKIKKGNTLNSNELLWIDNTGEETAFKYLNSGLKIKSSSKYIPLSIKTQILSLKDTTVKPLDTLQLIQTTGIESIRELYNRFCSHLKLFINNYDKYVDNKIEYYQIHKKTVLNDTIEQARAIMNPKSFISELKLTTSDDLNILRAFEIVGKTFGLEIKNSTKKISDFETAVEYLRGIGNEYSVHVREFRLAYDWWKHDGMSFLAFNKDTDTACAVISEHNHYVIIDPATFKKIKVDKKRADKIYLKVFTFHPILKQEKVCIKDLLKLIFLPNKKDFIIILLMGLITALLGLLTPIFTELIINKGIVYSNVSLVFQLTLALIIAGIAITSFSLIKSLSILRFEAKSNAFLQSAVIDRLFKLPMNFFRKYSAGDLAMRAMGIETIQRLLTGAHINAILGGIFSVTSLALMFYYSWQLALFGVCMVITTSIISVIFSLRQLKYIQSSLDLSGEASGIAFQLCSGLSKLKIMDKENQGFAVWGNLFSKYSLCSFNSKKLARNQTVSEFGIHAIVQLVIYGSIAWIYKGHIGVAVFVAFLAAFAQFSAGIKNLTSVIATILPVKALYVRLKPILEAKVELDSNKKTPTHFIGEIGVNNISFRYSKDSPLILDSVSIKINPGEFVAFVGSSGAGKSTLFRVLLGLEKAEQGTIFFDGQDINGLNLEEFRQKIGVVTQKAQLIPGSILENITGSGQYSEAEAWKAAILAGLEEDIKSFPMGMHTVVAEGSRTFSGGQKQRLIIARALIKSPKILLLDEATSALDNKTQEIVSKSLERIKATRIVIAHRLSTIQHADRIYVMNKGKIVESGNFNELMKLEGLFYSLAKRQIV